MSTVTSRSRYINMSHFKRPLKQFGLKMSAKCSATVQNVCCQKCYSMLMWRRQRKTEKARLPIVAWRTLGMTRSVVDDGIQLQCEGSFGQWYNKQDAFISYFVSVFFSEFCTLYVFLTTDSVGVPRVLSSRIKIWFDLIWCRDRFWRGFRCCATCMECSSVWTGSSSSTDSVIRHLVYSASPIGLTWIA